MVNENHTVTLLVSASLNGSWICAPKGQPGVFRPFRMDVAQGQGGFFEKETLSRELKGG